MWTGLFMSYAGTSSPVDSVRLANLLMLTKPQGLVGGIQTAPDACIHNVFQNGDKLVTP